MDAVPGISIMLSASKHSGQYMFNDVPDGAIRGSWSGTRRLHPSHSRSELLSPSSTLRIQLWKITGYPSESIRSNRIDQVRSIESDQHQIKSSNRSGQRGSNQFDQISWNRISHTNQIKELRISFHELDRQPALECLQQQEPHSLKMTLHRTDPFTWSVSAKRSREAD